MIKKMLSSGRHAKKGFATTTIEQVCLVVFSARRIVCDIIIHAIIIE